MLRYAEVVSLVLLLQKNGGLGYGPALRVAPRRALALATTKLCAAPKDWVVDGLDTELALDDGLAGDGECGGRGRGRGWLVLRIRVGSGRLQGAGTYTVID